MKKDIHPTYTADTKVTCACGNSFAVGSTLSEIQTEICSNCHPFFTGKQNLVDTAGRVDRFKAKLEASAKIKESKSQKKSDEATDKPEMDNKEKLEKIKAELDNK